MKYVITIDIPDNCKEDRDKVECVEYLFSLCNRYMILRNAIEKRDISITGFVNARVQFME